MTERPSETPVYTYLKDTISSGEIEHIITSDELHVLFKRQAEVDDSEDKPELLSNFVAEFGMSNSLYIFAPYTVSSLDNPNQRIGLAIEGRAYNDRNGLMSQKDSVSVHTDRDTKLRVMEAFDEQDRLPIFVFLKLMIEDALENTSEIENMSIEDYSLKVLFKK